MKFPDIGKSFQKSLWVMTRFWEKYFFMGKYSWNLPGNSFRKIPWITPQNCKIWKKFPGYSPSHRPFFGNSFRDSPIWVKMSDSWTVRFCFPGLVWENTICLISKFLLLQFICITIQNLLLMTCWEQNHMRQIYNEIFSSFSSENDIIEIEFYFCCGQFWTDWLWTNFWYWYWCWPIIGVSVSKRAFNECISCS